MQYGVNMFDLFVKMLRFWKFASKCSETHDAVDEFSRSDIHTFKVFGSF